LRCSCGPKIAGIGQNLVRAQRIKKATENVPKSKRALKDDEKPKTRRRRNNSFSDLAKNLVNASANQKATEGKPKISKKP